MNLGPRIRIGRHRTQEDLVTMPRHVPSRRASTSSILPRPTTNKSGIRKGPRSRISRHTESKAPPFRSTASIGNLRASANDRKKKRNKLKMDSLANAMSAMDSLATRMEEMQVDPSPNDAEEPTPHDLDSVPIESRIWLKVTFQNPPIPNCTLHSLSLAITEVPNLQTLHNEIIRTISETCRVRRREIPAPDSWRFRVTTGGLERTFWIAQPSRDVLADGEPIYQVFAADCRALGEEERQRLETAVASEPFFFGGGRRQKQVNRIVQMVGQDEPAFLAQAWASCEVSFPVVRQVVEMELDDLPM